MRTCDYCNIDVPGVMAECPSCNRKLGEAEFSLQAAEDRNTRFYQPAGMNDLLRSTMAKRQGATILPPTEYRKMKRAELRGELENFYDRFGYEIADCYSRTQLAEYLRQYLTNDCPAASFQNHARSLVKQIYSHVKRKQDAIRREEEALAQEERRRQEALRDEQNERDREHEMASFTQSALNGQISSMQNEVVSLQGKFGDIEAILDNPNADAELKLKAIQALIQHSRPATATEYDSVDAEGL